MSVCKSVCISMSVYKGACKSVWKGACKSVWSAE